MTYIPNICAPLKTDQTTSYETGDDGDLELGVSKSYTTLTTGQYSGTSNITVNSKTHALSNNCVKDNRTGLMWARYVPNADIGPATMGSYFGKSGSLQTRPIFRLIMHPARYVAQGVNLIQVHYAPGGNSPLQEQTVMMALTQYPALQQVPLLP